MTGPPHPEGFLPSTWFVDNPEHAVQITNHFKVLGVDKSQSISMSKDSSS